MWESHRLWRIIFSYLILKLYLVWKLKLDLIGGMEHPHKHTHSPAHALQQYSIIIKGNLKAISKRLFRLITIALIIIIIIIICGGVLYIKPFCFFLSFDGYQQKDNSFEIFKKRNHKTIEIIQRKKGFKTNQCVPFYQWRK